MYSDLCNRCYQTGHSKHGVFNKLAFHTAGRTANIGSLNVDHFITNEDCIAVQFPVTKTNQVGSESATPAALSYVHADGTTRAVPTLRLNLMSKSCSNTLLNNSDLLSDIRCAQHIVNNGWN